MCRLILLISEHPIQQGIRKGGGPHFCHEERRGEERTEWRILGSRIHKETTLRSHPLEKLNFVTTHTEDKTNPPIETAKSRLNIPKNWEIECNWTTSNSYFIF